VEGKGDATYSILNSPSMQEGLSQVTFFVTFVVSVWCKTAFLTRTCVWCASERSGCFQNRNEADLRPAPKQARAIFGILIFWESWFSEARCRGPVN